MRESLATLANLLTRSDFLAGLLGGLVCLGVLYVAARDDRGPAWWGTLFGFGAVGVMILVLQVPLGVTSGVVLLGVGGWMLDPLRDRRISPIGWVLAALGGGLIGWRGELTEIGWLPGVTALAALIAGGALSLWSQRLPHRLVGPLMAITAFGIWVTVPETEHARVLLGIALPLGLATLSPIRARLSVAGAFATGGVLVWVVALGGQQRPGSIVAGWACLGLLAVTPSIRANASQAAESRPWIVLGAHALFVFLVSRVIGMWESAVVASIAVMMVSIVFLILLDTGARSVQPSQSATHGPE